MTILYVGAAFVCALIGGTLIALHIREYRRLYESLLARGLPIEDLYVEGLDYGSRGCVPKIAAISKRLAASDTELTVQEQALARRSRMLYYTGGLVAVLGFIAFLGLFVFSSQQ